MIGQRRKFEKNGKHPTKRGTDTILGERKKETN